MEKCRESVWFLYTCVLMNDEQHKYTVLHPKKFDDSPTNFHFFKAFLEVVYIQRERERERERKERKEKRERENNHTELYEMIPYCM